MCHSTHGNKSMDSFKSLELAETALRIALEADAQVVPGSKGVLCPGGALVMKLLQGPGTVEFGQQARPYFDRLVWHRPKATRRESKEVYLLGLGRKPGVEWQFEV